MNNLVKKIYWRLPIPQRLKTKISQKRYERIIRKEEIQDANDSVNITYNRDLNHDYSKYVLEQHGIKSKDYRAFINHNDNNTDIHLAAYYLTQYHPNDQNDQWWGKGTTEWNNVNQAMPQFIGHYQPRKPGELGYYDLRLKEVFKQQIDLAKNYGITMFCFYYYWFDGERLLERPLNMFLENQDLNIQFCYCWANENWTKRFNGTDEGVLVKITETKENYELFIDSVLKDFNDNRYYRINGKPVISVYRPSLIPEPQKVMEVWREKAKTFLGTDLYIIAVQERDVTINWIAAGFDAETEFQPKQIQHSCKEITREMQPIRRDFGGHIFDYKHLVENKIYELKENKVKKVYPAVMPMWDNSARRNYRGLIFHGSTPELYKRWLEDVVDKVCSNTLLDEKLVFINAWNEWGEGSYLEPDDYFGYAYLQATYEAIENRRNQR